MAGLAPGGLEIGGFAGFSRSRRWNFEGSRCLISNFLPQGWRPWGSTLASRTGTPFGVPPVHA